MLSYLSHSRSCVDILYLKHRTTIQRHIATSAAETHKHQYIRSIQQTSVLTLAHTNTQAQAHGIKDVIFTRSESSQNKRDTPCSREFMLTKNRTPSSEFRMRTGLQGCCKCIDFFHIICLVCFRRKYICTHFIKMNEIFSVHEITKFWLKQ